jgi:hypothetical protein
VRIYTETEYLSFQGCTLSKALLEFCDGGEIKKTSNNLVDETLRSFKIYGANCYGLGHKSFDERVAWCDKQHDNVRSI